MFESFHANIINQMQSRFQTKEHNLSDGSYPIRPEFINEVAQLYTEGYLKSNPVWSQAGLSRPQMLDIFNEQIRSHLKAEQNLRLITGRPTLINCVYIRNGEIVMSCLSYELHHYLKLTESSQDSSKATLAQVFDQKTKQYFGEEMKTKKERGKYIYGNWLVSKPTPGLDWKVRAQRLAEVLLTLKEQGFKKMYFRATSRKAVAWFEQAGAVAPDKTEFEHQGKNYELYFSSIEMDNPMLNKYAQMRAKLSSNPKL